MPRKAEKGAVLRQSPQHARHSGDGFWIAAEVLATAVILVDDRARIIRCNSAAEMLFGLSGRALAGTDLTALIDGLKGWFAAPEVKIAQGVPCSLVTELSTPLQAARHVFVTATSAEEPGRYLVEVSDTHEALERFREEHQSDLSGAARGMLRNLAHEIKNPLGAISIHIQLIQKALEKARENDGVLPARKFVEDHIDVVNEEIDHLNKLVMDFLLAVRPVKAQLELKEPDKLIENLVSFFKPEFNREGIEVVFKPSESGIRMLLDEKLFRDVIMNISQNQETRNMRKRKSRTKSSMMKRQILVSYISTIRLRRIY